jgi:hypothetical protein
MGITRVIEDALKISGHPGLISVTTSGELAPVEAEVYDQ